MDSLAQQPTLTCSAEIVQSQKIRSFVGAELTPEVKLRLKMLSGASRVRIIKPNVAVTTERSSDRLNIQIDDQNTIVSIRCG
jgi:hypothetical protein